MPPTNPPTALVKVPKDLEQQTKTAVLVAQKFVVKDAATQQEAADRVNMLDAAIKKVKGLFQDPLEKAKAALAALKASIDTLVDPAEQAKGIYRRKLGDYQTEQARIRREEEARVEAERRRKEEEAEAKRRGLLKQGKKEAAARVVAKPVQAIVQAPEPPKPEGMSFRTDWKFEITDPKKVPDEYWRHEIDEVRLGQVVRALKEQANIPGVRVFSEEVPIRSRSF